MPPARRVRYDAPPCGSCWASSSCWRSWRDRLVRCRPGRRAGHRDREAGEARRPDRGPRGRHRHARRRAHTPRRRPRTGRRQRAALQPAGQRRGGKARPGERHARPAHAAPSASAPSRSSRQGKARIVVTATRPVLFGYREASASASRDVEVRLTPPRVGVVSTAPLHQPRRLGGGRLSRPARRRRVGRARRRRRTIPASPPPARASPAPTRRCAWRSSRCSTTRTLNAPISVFARDEAGNEVARHVRLPRVPQAVPQEPHRGRRHVPAQGRARRSSRTRRRSRSTIRANLLASFLAINRDLRKQNNADDRGARRQDGARDAVERPVQAAGRTPRSNRASPISAPTSTRARKSTSRSTSASTSRRRPRRRCTRRTRGRVRARRVPRHLRQLRDRRPRHGPAVALRAPVDRSTCRPGDRSRQGQTLGRSGATGLAGGDHLHFTMLLGGHAVTPVDWWSTQWVEDRVLRKLREAGPRAPPRRPLPTRA